MIDEIEEVTEKPQVTRTFVPKRRQSKKYETLPALVGKGSHVRRNMLIGAVVVLVIVVAIVGGVVGGLQAKHKHNAAALSSSTGGSSSGSATPTSTGVPAPAPAPTGKTGCNTTSAWTFDSTGHYNVTMGNRTFYVHTPVNYNNVNQHPVVLSFHGYSQNESYQETISGFSDPGLEINSLGLIAVYPAGAWGPGKPTDGYQRAWQGAPYSQPEVDDIAYTQNLVQELQENLCVDQSRMYAAGKSNGGGFVNLLACTSSTSGLFAAYAPVSAALYPGTDSFSGCNPGRPVPIVNFHGLADTIEPFTGQTSQYGDTGYATPDIQTWRDQWASRNGCQNPTASENVTKSAFISTTEISYECSTNNPAAQVIGYNIANLGHTWPNTVGLDGGMTTFNATNQVIVPFFGNLTTSA